KRRLCYAPSLSSDQRHQSSRRESEEAEETLQCFGCVQNREWIGENMRAVVQRVLSSEVIVNGDSVGRIGKGFNVLLGIKDDDTREDMNYIVEKIKGLRVFEDSEGKMNLSLTEVEGEILMISQF